MSDTISASLGVTAPQKPGFAYTVNLNDSQHLGATVDQELVTDMDASLNDWGQYIGGTGKLIVQLNITPTTRENGGPTSGEFVSVVGSHDLYTPSSIYELTTGQHVAGTTSDITITVDPTYLLQDVWLDPNPGSSEIIPSNLQDQVAVFRHEIGHGLGISGFTTTFGTLGTYEFPWDTYLEKDNPSVAYFDGPNAEAAYGGKVPVTTLPNGEGYAHLANSITDPLGQDLMNGVAFNGGTDYDISAVDLAILKDVGAPVVVSTPHPMNVTFYGSDTEIKDALTGEYVQTLPPTPTNPMQFLNVDGRQYGANLVSAESLGLDPTQLRDYDGNNLGAPAGWEFKGMASVEAGLDPSYILVNPTIGRWAEVLPQINGTFNFGDHGQNGHTRVVGIYEDPLVKMGLVVKGSDTDSQTRFLSDIDADRLAVLGTVTDTSTGFIDLFFKLTNHNADHHDDVYLRAIMHVDGNIQYANYVNTNQFLDFMNKNGTPGSVYSNWLTQA